MKILCDIDGVLAAFTEHVAMTLSAWGFNRKYEDFTDYQLSKGMDISERRALERLPSNGTFCFNVPRYPLAQKSMRTLTKKHSVHLVTSAWTGPFWHQSRQDWIESFLSSPDLRSVTWQFATPEERVRLPGDMLIDDRIETLREWAKTDRPSILINHPWNQGEEPAKCIRVADFSRVLEHV